MVSPHTHSLKQMANYNQLVTYTKGEVTKTKTVAKNSPAAATRAVIAEEGSEIVIVSIKTTPIV
jgi:hypothetical protein